MRCFPWTVSFPGNVEPTDNSKISTLSIFFVAVHRNALFWRVIGLSDADIQPFARVEAAQEEGGFGAVVEDHYREDPVHRQAQPEEDEGGGESPENNAAKGGNQRKTGVAGAS